jgi:hypothetical protein
MGATGEAAPLVTKRKPARSSCLPRRLHPANSRAAAPPGRRARRSARARVSQRTSTGSTRDRRVLGEHQSARPPRRHSDRVAPVLRLTSRRSPPLTLARAFSKPPAGSAPRARRNSRAKAFAIHALPEMDYSYGTQQPYQVVRLARLRLSGSGQACARSHLEIPTPPHGQEERAVVSRTLAAVRGQAQGSVERPRGDAAKRRAEAAPL